MKESENNKKKVNDKDTEDEGSPIDFKKIEGFADNLNTAIKSLSDGTS